MPPGVNNKRLKPGAGQLMMRLYGQGLGDCFLLAFPRKGKPDDPCYLVIDCGAAMSTPGRAARMKKVVENIREATGGHIDALAITHQHFDHISGFQDAWQEWKLLKVDSLLLPWTEATAEKGEAKSTKAFRDILDRAAKKALEKAEEAGILDSQPGFRAQADFLGVTLGADKTKGPGNMDEAMEFARNLCPEKIHYFAPGDVFSVFDTGFHGYVLGPPLPDNLREKDQKKYVELLVDEDGKVMYSYAPLGMEVDEGKPGGANAFALSDNRSLPALASGLLAMDSLPNPSNRGADEAFCPFAPRVRLAWDDAMSSDFFVDHYGDREERGENGSWRRVDFDWLAGAANLALRAGDYTNNVSLVLAFDIPDSDKMLLFPGDAQVGNWLSWHTIKSWNFCDESIPLNPPASSDNQTLMDNLLSRICFYKVGHHGSHNATVKEQGLEKMTRKDLVAYIPVSVPVAQDFMGYCPMPFYPVIRALQTRTNGRVFLANGKAVGPLPDGKNNGGLLKASRIVVSKETLDKKVMDGVEVEGPVPLFLEMTIRA